MKRKKMNFSSLSLDSFTLSLIVKQNKAGKVHKEKQRAQKAKFLWPCSFWLNFSIISLHVEKNEKGTKIRKKKRIQKTECLFFFQISSLWYFWYWKKHSEESETVRSFLKTKKIQEGDCFELAGFFPSSRCAWWCTCQSINKSLGIQRNLNFWRPYFAIQRGSIGKLLEFVLSLRLFRFFPFYFKA